MSDPSMGTTLSVDVIWEIPDIVALWLMDVRSCLAWCLVVGECYLEETLLLFLFGSLYLFQNILKSNGSLSAELKYRDSAEQYFFMKG